MNELVWRPLARSDARRTAELLAVCERADGTGDRRGEQDVLDGWAASGVDLAVGTTSAWAGSEPVAYAVTRTREQADPVHEMTVEIAVHPAHRTSETAAYLLARGRRAAARRHRERFTGTPLELHTRTHGRQRWLAGELDAAGYRRARSYLGMRIDLVRYASAAAPPLPRGTAIVPFEDRYDAPLLAARNEIFADTWGSVRMTAATWRHSVTASPYFRPASSFLLLSAESREILCYLLATELADAGAERELYLANAGTRPDLHGRGLYRAVFTHTLARAKARGYRWAVADVDSANTMAAGGFYERMGLRTFRTWTGHVLDLAGAAAGSTEPATTSGRGDRPPLFVTESPCAPVGWDGDRQSDGFGVEVPHRRPAEPSSGGVSHG
ncbi:GNAT family N-acetyltransferase [Kitasatospora sp. NPDC091207]|uniref:GNAT family N-acetyltransferase n=1 Tax=Kitasatospora sp. NPDC091207 TaxID=3364083 RepID=UPI003810EC49